MKKENKQWKPKKGDFYCYPDFHEVGHKGLYDYTIWNNDDGDKKIYELGLVFKTKKEAINCSKEMLKLKEGIKNEVR